MDWKIFFAAFSTVFLAELGDKTQLATLLFSTQSKSPVLVFAGSALALVLSSFLAVVAGQYLAARLPENIIKGAAAVGFILIGVWLLYGLVNAKAA